MRLSITILLVCFALVLTGCDALDFFAQEDGNPSPAQNVAEDVSPLIPNGLPRVLADIVLAGLAIIGAYTAKKSAIKDSEVKLATRHEGGYTLEEAQAMVDAIAKLKVAGTDTAVS